MRGDKEWHHRPCTGQATDIVEDCRRSFELVGGKTQLQKEGAQKRPWDLIKNGDLSQSLGDVVNANNPETIKLTKVKGHATGEMVQKVEVNQEDKEGNPTDSRQGRDKRRQRMRPPRFATGSR